MKRSIWMRVLAMVLAFSMLGPVAASAATVRGGSGGKIPSVGDWFRSKIEEIIGNIGGLDEENTAEMTGPGEGETSGGVQTMTTIEDQSTVENGDMLRASTYALSTSYANDVNAAADTTTLKYFPVTLYDYDTDTINNATHQLEVNNGLADEWEGLYFSGGDPAAQSYTYSASAAAHDNLTWAQVISGTYYADEDRTARVTVSTVTEGFSTSYSEADVTVNDLISANSTSWQATNYYYKDGDNYYPLYAKRSSRSSWGSTTYTYTWGYSANGGSSVSQIGNTQTASSTSTKPDITVYEQKSVPTVTGYTMTAGGNTIATLSGTDTAQPVGVTLYTASGTQTTASLPYAAWNWWNKNSGNNANGDLLYTGLVQPTLDANKNIVFNVPDAGIFNEDTSVKTIYTNVELPFYLDTDGYYTFNSDVYGAYFHEDATQGSSGTAASNTRLYFNQSSTQSNGGKYGDGSSTVWAPFNDGTSFTESTMNYHFGMSATVPFTMTSDGKVHEGVEDSDDITFTFSGDDDVWVFVDGQLVIDLGGIHNRLSATINFADNTVTYFEDNTADTDNATGSYNDGSFATTQTLFGGLIPQDRITFAATDNHELTVYILERGKGSSNAQVKFNLPVKDVVSVQKIIDGVATYVDGSITTTTGLSSLTAEQIAVLNNQDFTFTLYKNGAVVANETFVLLNANGQIISTPSTDANGQFVLKNGQTAKFTGTMSTDGDTYYVVEDIKNGFIYTDFDYTSKVAGATSDDGISGAYSYGTPSGAYYVTDMTVSGGTLESQTVTVAGGEEAEDSLAFVCKNYMNATLPNPSAIPNDEKVVIDFGLNVVIDLFSNDLHLADTTEITFPNYTAVDGVYTAEYGTFTYNAADGTITYTLTEQLTGVEVINYTLTGYAGDNMEYSDSGTANVYIIPATAMYYEENFSDMVTYTGSWSNQGSADNTVQEPGVVGTVSDSPYGSDAAYLNDSADSNGTSKYVSTAGGAAKFSYTFTGTGTSFYARTNNNTGYIRVVVTDESGNTVQTVLRDTKYKGDGTLYNIPVFIITDLHYGTYTVTVSIAKGSVNFGYDFYLDGIRVYQPLDPDDANASVATSAYATDAEANMVSVTLRNKLISDMDLDEDGNPVWTEGSNFVLFTDVDGELETAEEYVSFGPKEEVYINDGQSVTFSLYDWDPNTNKLYLGIKAPTGSGTVTIGSTTLTIRNTVDCYYDISSYGTVTTDEDGIKTITFTITAGSGSLISLTDIKVTGTFEFTIIEETDIDISGYENEDEQDVNEEGNDVEITSEEEVTVPVGFVVPGSNTDTTEEGDE